LAGRNTTHSSSLRESITCALLSTGKEMQEEIRDGCFWVGDQGGNSSGVSDEQRVTWRKDLETKKGRGDF